MLLWSVGRRMGERETDGFFGSLYNSRGVFPVFLETGVLEPAPSEDVSHAVKGRVSSWGYKGTLD